MSEIEYEAVITWKMIVSGKSYADIESKIKAITDVLDFNKKPYSIRPTKPALRDNLSWLDR